MPQFTIEYSPRLEGATDFRALALELHAAAVETIGTELQNCKTRLVRHAATVIGDGDGEQAMLHLDLRILSGRTDAQKAGLSERALAAAVERLRDAPIRTQITVEVRDLDRVNYRKALIGYD